MKGLALYGIMLNFGSESVLCVVFSEALSHSFYYQLWNMAKIKSVQHFPFWCYNCNQTAT